MKLKHLYAILCILGAVLPYAFFVPFLLEHGLNLPLFFEQLFANRISAFFGMDVIVSALVLWVFIYAETRHRPVPLWWLPLLATLTVGVSLAFPLFLLLREYTLEQTHTVRNK